MYQMFLTNITKNLEEVIKGNTLLAVSGGLDSMVMANLFLKSGWNFGIAHCNFQLRGEDSDKDQELISRFASENKIPIHVKSFNTHEHAAQNGISVQMAARELRYSFFNELLRTSYSRLAIAHHRDDQFETVLFNLIKGTGIKGLRGWKDENHKICRPLLFAKKADLIHYAKKEAIVWREDSSNERTDYLRNKIRHEIIPAIKEINQNYLETFEGSKKRLAESADVLHEYLQKFKNKATVLEGKDMIISVAELKDCKAPLQSLLHIISEFGFNLTQCQELLRSVEHVGITFHSPTHVLNVDRGRILLSPISPIQESVLIEDVSMHVLKTGDSLSSETVPNHSSIDLTATDQFRIMLDKAKLSFPLKIRAPKEGDSFFPLGLRGKKKVSDFMIDEKIPVNLKNRVLVLESANNIVWIIGHRIDDRYKVTSATREIIQLTYTHASQPI